MIDEARHYMGESARAMLEAGARLALIRSQEPHGEWMAACERLNLEVRTAQRMINAALKFSNTTTSSHLDRIGTSKLFELLVLDDDDAGTLAQGGEVEGIGDLDDIARMTVRELRAALRELRAESAAKDKLLEAKNRKLDQLTAQLERKKAGTPAEEWHWAPARRMLLDACETLANFSQTELRRALVEIQARAEAENSLPEDIEVLQGHALSSVMQTLVVLQKEFRIAVDLEAIVMPPWLQDFKSAGTANKRT
ncbi:hypothetical protein D3870_21365 [Noviherbaspirillum cavernae]|uniref:DUF3102 domain-containing protein n=2 Tax=Noviherbaspirillum cavernae TaxID=2320862 RepID=A0A418WWD7_9BURK|nr:hypothetical protein D3870_21365 [Noviherbaspirillum cavernae]